MVPFDDFYSRELQTAINKLLTLDYKERPTAEQILQFQIFENIKKISKK